MTYNPYAYQDPYGGYGSYGGYDPYGGYDQSVEDSSPPEPSKDWEDVPKINRPYIRKIRKVKVQEDFKHIISEKLYVVEVMVEYIELNEELMVKQNTKDAKVEKIKDEEIITTLKVLHLPPSVLSVARDERQLQQVTTLESQLSLPRISFQLSQLFQRILSHVNDFVDLLESEVESEKHEEEDESGEDGGIDEAGNDKKPTVVNKIQEEKTAEESRKRCKVDVMEGKSVVLMMSGIQMIQKLQAHGVGVTITRTDVSQTEEGETSETIVLLGTAYVRLPQDFQHTVLRQSATRCSFSIPLVKRTEEGEDMESEVGEVRLTVTLVSVGEGVEIAMSEGQKVYREVDLIKAFPPQPLECVFDPTVHPRLAVILMNMEPPLDLNRTSTEIIQRCLESNLIQCEEDECVKYKSKNCRWLDISKDLTRKHSESWYSNTSSLLREGNKTSMRVSFPSTGQDIDPGYDLGFQWRQHKRHCRNLWEDAELLESNKRALYDELEELIRQDKGDGWDTNDLSEKSIKTEKTEKSEEEVRTSKSLASSKRST